MRAAFFTYPSAFQNVGGGEVLLLKLKEYLEKEGMRVDFFDSWHAKVEDYDWLHVFGSVKDCLGLVRVANARKVKVAITPLLWTDWSSGPFLRHLTKMIYPRFPSDRRELLLRSDLIFPNSETEKGHLERFFALPPGKMKVVYNGVDEKFARSGPSLFTSRFGNGPFVLSVGRIEPRKNQLNLIRAVKKTGKKLVLIGSAVSGYENYGERCRKEGEGFTVFLPTLAHEDPMLGSAYAACELFVLPAWFETPGLAALEAALAGAKLLVTKGGSTREYFKHYAEYLDPSNVEDIRRKILSAIQNAPPEGLRSHILERYTWKPIAQATRRFYEEAAHA